MPDIHSVGKQSSVPSSKLHVVTTVTAFTNGPDLNIFQLFGSNKMLYEKSFF